ncbi:hypothetical protein D3C79_842510 [compost metagenome]
MQLTRVSYRAASAVFLVTALTETAFLYTCVYGHLRWPMLLNLRMNNLLAPPHQPLNPLLVHGAKISRISGGDIATDHVGVLEGQRTILLP